MSFKLIVKISKEKFGTKDKLTIEVYEDGFVKIQDNEKITTKKISKDKVLELKKILHEYIVFTNDYVKMCPDVCMNNCKIVIRITNPYKNRPFTKVVNNKKLFNQLFTLIVEG